MIKCNGVRLDRVRYPSLVRGTVLGLIRVQRGLFIEDGEYVPGQRANDDEQVLATLESSALEEDFYASPADWVDAAITDCMERDSWYVTEKVWT